MPIFTAHKHAKLVTLLILPLSMTAACSLGTVSTLEEMSNNITREVSELGNTNQIRVVEIDLSQGLAAALPGAIAASSGYRAALARESEAEAARASAIGARRVQASVSGTAGGIREGSTPRTASDTTTGLAANLNLSQLLFDGGASAGRVDATTAAAIAARTRSVATASDVAVAAAQAWADLWLAQQRILLMDQQTSAMDEMLDQITRMSESGLVDRGATDTARNSILEIQVQRAGLNQTRTAAEAAFRRYFKALPEGSLSLNAIVSTDYARRSASDWRKSPDILVAGAELLGARANLAIAEAAFSPSASLRAGVTSPMNEDDSTDVNVGVALNYDFTRGGSRQADLEAAQARLAAADAALDEAHSAVRSELDALTAQLDFLEARALILDEQRDLSRTQAETVRSQIATGQSSLSELFRAEVASYQAEDELLQVRADLMMLRVSVAARAGGLVELLNLGPRQ